MNVGIGRLTGCGADGFSFDALRTSDARIDETEQRLQVISEQAPVMLWMSEARSLGHSLRR